MSSGKFYVLLMMLMFLPLLNANAQQAPPKKAPTQRASMYSYLPDGYVQVGTTQLYYKQNADAIDMIGYYNGYYYSSTYSDYGYKLSVQVGSNSAIRVDCLNGTTDGGVTVQPSIEQQGELARICYTVTNANETDVVISLGTHADVMIGNNDSAPISRRIDTLGQPYGLTMKDGNGAQLCVLFGTGLAGVTAVSNFWFGHWSDNSEPSYMVGNYYEGSNWMIEDSSYDSGMGWCWQDRTIAAGSTVIFSYLIGVGEVNLEPNSSFEVTPDDAEGWNDLSRPHVLTLEGTYESPAGLEGRIEYAVEDSEEWTPLTEMLPSGGTFSGEITAMFDATKSIHTIRFRTVDNVGNTSMLHPIEYKDVSFYPVTGIEEKTYTGSELFQENLTCELDNDQYEVKNYRNNVRVGWASFSVEGVFPKTIGRKTYSFQILPQPLSGELLLEETNFVYSGDAFTPAWQFSNESYANLVSGEDYTAEWANNTRVGTGTLTVTGKNNYSGTLTANIQIDKAPFAIELLGLQLPDVELIYDEQPHPASCSQNCEGVGEVTITYLMEETGVETPQPPVLPGKYTIYVAVAEGALYYGMAKTEVGTVTISLFNTEQYAYISKIATDTENYHMYAGTRRKLVQFLQSTVAALESGDLATIHEAFLPQEALLAEAQASMADYDKLAGYIYYTQRLSDSYGFLFSADIKATIQQTITGLQTAYNYGAMTGEQIDQVWPQLQETTRSELTKYMEPYTNSIATLMAQGLTEDLHNSTLQILADAQALLTWNEYSIENIDYIKGVAQRVIAIVPVLQAQVKDLAILRQAYLSLGGAEQLAQRWQFETKPYRLDGVTFTDGFATSINLAGCELAGTLPTSFFMLPNLEVLDLSGNRLRGDINVVWEQLIAMNQTSPLTTLNIGGNDFTGNIGKIGSVCPELRSLNAIQNHLQDCQPGLNALMENVNLRLQKLDFWTWDFLLSESYAQENMQQLPGILRYDHNAVNGVATKQTFSCHSENWSMDMFFVNGLLASIDADTDFTGSNGDLLDVILETNTAQGSTFRMNFKFLPGDANFSGKADINDLQTVIRYIFKDWGTGINYTAANLFVDDRVNVQDVVRLVDGLLASGESTLARRKAPARMLEDEDATANLFWRGNELVLRTDVPVAVADIFLDGNATLSWKLQQMGFTLAEKRTETGTHAIFYSLSDAELPAGETVLATKAGGSADLTFAMLSDRDAQSITTALSAPMPTKIGLMAAEGPWTLVSAGGTIVAQGKGRSQLKSAQRRLGTGFYILQGSNNQIQKITIK